MIKEEYSKEYKDAVEQIQLSDRDKDELLEAVLGQKTVVRKRKRLPYYAGGVVAAAAVMLLIVGSNTMLFSQNEKKADMGIMEEKDDALVNGISTEDYDAMESAEAGESDGAESSMEASGELYETFDSVASGSYGEDKQTAESEQESADNTSEGFGAEVFCVVAYDKGIEPADGEGTSSTQNESAKKTAGNKNSGVQDGNTEGLRLEPGKSYSAYTQDVPSCTIALFENDGYVCDSYRIRLAGSVAKVITEEGTEGEAVSDLQVKSGEKVCIQVKKAAAEKGCTWDSKRDVYTGLDGMEEDVWEDKDMLTVAQIMIEAVKDDEIVSVRQIYIGRKGEWYYGLVQ